MRQLKTIISISFIFFVFFGCSVAKFPYIQESSIIDYSKYSKKGFFMTESNSVSFDYMTIGSVTAKVNSGYEVKDVNTKEYIDDAVYSGDPSVKLNINYGKYIKATTDKAIEELYNRAVENDANGIIELSITPITETNQQFGTVITGYFVSGMAIKRQ